MPPAVGEGDEGFDPPPPPSLAGDHTGVLSASIRGERRPEETLATPVNRRKVMGSSSWAVPPLAHESHTLLGFLASTCYRIGQELRSGTQRL